MRKMLLIAAAAALLAPAAALATKPPHPSQAKNDPTSSPTVLYVLRGTLAPTYDTQDPTKLVSIGITVMSANHDGKTLKALPNQPLTFTLGPKTKVVLHKRLPIATGDRGMIKVRFAKSFDPTDSAKLGQFLSTAPTQILDQGTHAYSGKGESNSHASTWLYVLHGTLQSYSPGPTGAVELTITKANHNGGVLKGATLWFTIDSSTKVGPAKATWTTGSQPDRVVVKLLGPKAVSTTAPYLSGTAKQIIDQGQ